MTLSTKILFSLLMLMSYGNTFAQAYNVSLTLPQVALMDIEQATSISLNPTKPTEAGSRLANPANNTTKWLNYTSAVASGGSRTISASINQTVPGIDIKLQAASASGSGGGTLGTPSSQVTLSTVPTTIISGIGGAYTGNGVGNGHQLTFSAVPNNYTNLNASNNTVTVTYTISDSGVSPAANIPVNVAGSSSAISIPPITEAGSDYGGTYTTSNPISPITLGSYVIPRSVLLGLTLLESGTIVSQIKMNYTPTIWNNSLRLYANRNGGTATITGVCVGCSAYFNNGTNYPEILQTDTAFFDLMFSGVLGLLVTQITYSNIPVSIRLGGVSVTIPAATYTSQINFHQ